MSIQFPSDEGHLEAARSRVLTRIRRYRRARLSIAIAGAVVVVATASGGALVVQQITAPQAQNTVACYAHDDLNSLSGTAAMAFATPSPGASQPAEQVANKAEMCALVWKAGLAQAAAHGGHWPSVDPNTSTLPVPALAYCVLSNGQTAGFPIEAPSSTAAQVCDRLGIRTDPTVHG